MKYEVPVILDLTPDMPHEIMDAMQSIMRRFGYENVPIKVTAEMSRLSLPEVGDLTADQINAIKPLVQDALNGIIAKVPRIAGRVHAGEIREVQ